MTFKKGQTPWNKNKKTSESIKIKIKKSCDKYWTEGNRKKQSELIKSKMTKEVKEKIGKKSQERWNDPEYRAKIMKTNPIFSMDLSGNKNPAKRPEVRKKISESKKGEKNSMYGYKYSEEEKERRSKMFSGKKNPFFGKKHTEVQKNKWSMKHKELWKSDEYRKKVIDNLPDMNGENNPMYGKKGKDAPGWKGGITVENLLLRTSKKYSEWRFNIFKKDNFNCKLCGNNRYLNAHHIHKFSKYPNERFDINNGITLCRNCHLLTYNKEEEWIETFLMIQNEGDLI